MKKKIIEGIEFLKLPKLSRKKEVEFIARTAIRQVADEMHFFLEVYRNEKACKDVPVVRIVVNKKDFGTFWPKDGSWSRRKITTNTYSNDGMIWQTEGIRRICGKEKDGEETILYGSEDLERIKRFFKDIKIWNDENWWEYISREQDHICCKERAERRRREYERRMAALKDRAEHTPDLDEQKLLEYADNFIYMNKHYLYYKKKGRRAEVCCSKCGGVSSGSFKPGISYESNFEKHIEEPRENQRGTCPRCHEPGIYKCQGKMKREHREEKHIFLMDRYKETGVVIRYVELGKEWKLVTICGKKGLEMYGAYEQLDGVEIARTYIHPEEKIQTDFQKHNHYSGEDFWDDCNLYGMANITVGSAEVHPESWENLEGTCLHTARQWNFWKKWEAVRCRCVTTCSDTLRLHRSRCW